jgi:membrane protein YdbS with pleckstrin-like domain
MSEAIAGYTGPAEPLPADLQQLDRRVKRLWRTSMATWSAILVPVPFVFGIITDRVATFGPAALAMAIVAALLLGAWPVARYQAWGYCVRESDVVLRHGVLWKLVSIVPHARIQHVDTRRGPLERALGLASVTIHTAGSVGATLTIPGLDAAHAEQLRDRLAALSGASDAV